MTLNLLTALGAEAQMIAYVLIILISLLIFLGLTNFIEQLARATTPRASNTFSGTKQSSASAGEQK